MLGPHGVTLSTTTYATIASAQLLALVALWTPSGIVWWRAEGAMFWAVLTAYAASWLFLVKASWDAGAEVQSGALGWLSLMANRKPRFPDMPQAGTFRSDPPAHLPRLRADHLAGAGLDTRSAGAGDCADRLLPGRPRG